MNNLSEKVSSFLENKKVENVKIINLEGKSPFFDFIIIGSLNNSRALDSIADETNSFLESLGLVTKIPEGNGESGWVLLDAGDFVIHLLSEEKRNELSLEEVIEKSFH